MTGFGRSQNLGLSSQPSLVSFTRTRSGPVRRLPNLAITCSRGLCRRRVYVSIELAELWARYIFQLSIRKPLPTYRRSWYTGRFKQDITCPAHDLPDEMSLLQTPEAPRARGIVVFGGGTATNSLVDILNELRESRRCNLSYVIPISDNGGSSSELIRVLGGPGECRVRETHRRTKQY